MTYLPHSLAVTDMCGHPHNHSAANHDVPEESRDRRRSIHRRYESCIRARHEGMRYWFQLRTEHVAPADKSVPTKPKLTETANVCCKEESGELRRWSIQGRKATRVLICYIKAPVMDTKTGSRYPRHKLSIQVVNRQRRLRWDCRRKSFKSKIEE